MRLFFINELDDVIAILALHQAAKLPFRLQSECCLLELRHHRAMLKRREFAALLRTTRIVGVLLGQFLEISAILNLFQDVFSLGFRNIRCLLIDFAIGSGSRRLDKDVANMHAFRHFVLLCVLVVVLLYLVVGDVHSGDIGAVNHHIARFALFRNGIDVLLLVLVVESLQFGVGDLHLFGNISLREHRVGELYLLVLL